MLRLPFLIVLCLAMAGPARAQNSEAFPKGRSFIIQLTSSQYSSGLGDYLVPPLEKAMLKTGLKYRGDAGAEFAATVESRSDVGKWYGTGDERKWLYERLVTVGLSPADVDVEPEGKLSPSFSVTVKLITPNEDRVDELDCLVALATRDLAARYVPKGNVLVNGQSCARK